MITTIIITTLASVFLTLVVGYFIWSGISVRKLKKQVKDNINDIKVSELDVIENDKRVNEQMNEITKGVSQVYDELDSKINELEKHLDNKINHDQDLSFRAREEIFTEMNKMNDENHRELDKRFDKVYQSLSEKK